MALTAANPVTVSPRNGNSLANGKEATVVIPQAPRYSTASTLAELPGYSTILAADTTGEELGKLFADHPDLPGVILFKNGVFAGVISQSHFYKCVSRAFGREIYYRRPATIMLSEMTTEVLTLPSDSAIYTAVDRCLTRVLDLVYEPFLVHNQASNEYRLCAVQVLLLASSQLAALRNQQMALILDSVTDGLLVIDRDFRIGSEYSRVVEKIFERSDLGHATLPDILHPLVDQVTHEQIRDYLKILFDPKLIDRLIKSINPAKQISVRLPAQEAGQKERTKHFAVNFERIRAQAEISQVLVQIEDITHQINLAKELALQEAAAEQKLHLVMEILQVEPISLNRFINHFNEGLAVLEPMIDFPAGIEDPREMIQVLFRRVHTLKGEAGLLRLGTHERLLHKLEDDLDALRSAEQLATSDLASLAPSVEALLELSSEISEIFDRVRSLDTTAKTPVPAVSPAPEAPPPAGLMESLARLVFELGGRLGKPAVFHTTVQESDLPAAYAEVLPEVLLHLVRNSMAHGFESSEERVARGKNPLGTIQLALREHPGFHELILQDDGGGLDLDKIRRRAEQVGWQLTTDEQLRHAIFEPGFSTADKVSDLAGRGVGLDAVRAALEKVGGRIIPHSQAGAYCAFQILLPNPPPSSAA